MSLTAPTVTGWSGFWQMVADQKLYSMPLSQARAKDAWITGKIFRGTGTRDAAGALAALIGAVAGGTATNTWRQVPSPSGPQQTVPLATSIGDTWGGTAVARNAINRVTTAADITELKKWFSASLLVQNTTYPTVLGSGGGGKIVQGVVGF